MKCSLLSPMFIIVWPEIVEQDMGNGQKIQSQQMVPHFFETEEKFTKALISLLKDNPGREFTTLYQVVDLGEEFELDVEEVS